MGEAGTRVWAAHWETQERSGGVLTQATPCGVSTKPAAHTHRDSRGRFLFSLLFSSIVPAVRRVGDIVFVATANDRATEKTAYFGVKLQPKKK